jgi:cytochrome c
VRSLIAAVFVASLAIGGAAAAEPTAKMGEDLFSQTCTFCHSTEAGGAAGAGPNLHGVVGRKPASAPGFAYSEALKKVTQPWTPATLDAWLSDPGKFAPGSQMPISTPKAEDRQALIEYLKTLK